MFFVVPGSGQALFGMPDMAVLNIINLNIDSIQQEIRNCKANRGQEIHTVTEDCTNKDAQSAVKQDDSSQQHHSQANKVINYFYFSNNTATDKSKSSAMTQNIHETFGDVFNCIGCFKAHFLYSSSWTANHIKHPQGMLHMHYRSHFRRNSSICRNWTL